MGVSVLLQKKILQISKYKFTSRYYVDLYYRHNHHTSPEIKV